jgi:3'(2'), 5'-bisphosphate nucleotidase
VKGKTLNLEPHTMEKICKIARDAGAAIMSVYEGDHAVEFKDDNSPLTAADRASHDIIVRGLKKHFPDIPVLSEEGRDIPYAQRKDWSRFWLVDPLDGTKEFIKRNGEFTVNIALVEGKTPVMGVVYVPAQDRMYFGVEGKGAFRQEGDKPLEPIRVRTPDLSAGLTVVMSRSHPSAELEDFLRDIHVAEALAVGSSLKLCAVAEGKADLYPRLGPTMEWDTGAGQALVYAAGGKVVQVDGSPLEYNKENLLNPYFIVSGDASSAPV